MRKYTDKDSVKKYLGIDFSSGLNTFVESVIEQVSQYIEDQCGDTEAPRVFEAPETEETRYFDGNNTKALDIGDVLSVSKVVSYGVELTEDEDFYLYPLNAQAHGKPYTSIELIQPETKVNSASILVSGSPYVFELGQKRHSVTGIFAYSETPPGDIALAALKLTGGVIKENIGDQDLREVSSESIGSYSVSFQSLQNIAHTLSVEEILNPYKKGGKNENNPLFAGIRKI